MTSYSKWTWTKSQNPRVSRILWSPDSVDFRIIRETVGSPFEWNVRKSYTAIAKKLAVDEETVRLRLRRMKRQGFLLRWRLIPNPMLIGRRTSALLMEFDDQPTYERAMLHLQNTDGVVIITEFYEMRVSVYLFHDYPQEQIAQTIASSCNGRVITSWQTEFPGVSRKLTKLDWEIIEGLMKNPERKLSDLADKLGVSTRTVKRRVKDMMGSYAFFLLPVLNLKKIKGVPCQLIVESDVSKKHAIDKMITSNFDPIMRFRNTESRTHSVYGIACANVTEGTEIRKSIENQPGVRTVRMNIVERLVHVYDWTESQVRLMVSRSDA